MNRIPAPDDDPLEELTSQAADEFMERLERGENPDVDEAVARHPQIADVLRRLLPALQAMRPSGTDPTPEGVAAVPEFNAERPGRLGDFEIVREIGRGGMGVVYEALQLSLGRRVALKVLPFAAMLDPNRLQRFQNEARAAACLHHGNIVPIFGVGCDRGVHFYAMQYIEGRNLAVLIQDARCSAGLPAAAAEEAIAEIARRDAAPSRTPFSPSAPHVMARPGVAAPTVASAAAATEALPAPDVSFQTAARLAAQAAEALHHAHEQGVVHRDMKPANLIVDAAGRLWVTDFGLAQVQSDPRLTTTGNVLGTLRYMSPEQASGEQTVDHRTDVYSLGATLYELLALEPAFGGRDRGTVLRRVIQEDPKPLRRINPSIPADLETIVGKAMAKLPADRYPTAQALADDLRRFLEDKPILARRPSLLEKAARWSRRRRGLVAAGIGVLLLAVCGLTASTLLFNWQMGKTQKAYDLLSKEEGRKEEALRAEAQQRRRAEQSAWKARQVLNYFTQESEEAIPDRQELQPVRRRLLEAALGYYKDFIEQQGDDPSVQAEMIASKLRVASILDEIGQKPDARAIREEVRAELRALGAAAPPGVFSGLGESAFLVSRLLTQSAVQQDLKLSDEQLQSIRALTALRDDPPTHPSNDDQPETAEKAWFAVLRPEQADRLRQIVWQQRGGHAFADADVADALGLNADQRERIHRIDEDAYRDFSPKHWGKYSESYWKGIGDQLLNVLTEEQKAKWKTMTGEPFHGEIHFGGPPTTLLPASPLEPPKQPD